MDFIVWVLIGVLSHYLISYIFLKYPLLIKEERRIKHKKIREAINSKKFFFFIHRGGPFHYLENTLEAFKYSDSLGVDGLEMDVYLTKDKKMIIFHDHELERIFGKPDLTEETNYADFNTPVKEVKIHFTNGARLVTEGKKIPNPAVSLLEDVFKGLPN